MNESNCSQEKEFVMLNEDLLRLEDARNKVINELFGIIERIKPQTNDQKVGGMPEPPQPVGILFQLRERARRIDISNSALFAAVERLNQLF